MAVLLCFFVARHVNLFLFSFTTQFNFCSVMNFTCDDNLTVTFVSSVAFSLICGNDGRLCRYFRPLGNIIVMLLIIFVHYWLIGTSTRVFDDVECR